ncbi:MAG: hypothetical protein ACKKL4_01345 [Patescibacteria group bacterium]
MTTHSIRYTQGQLKMYTYIWYLSFIAVALFIVVMFMLHNSTAYAYQIGELNQKSKYISEEIASLESAYKNQTAHLDNQEFDMGQMVRYSPAEKTVRYAQVGGSVYSMLTHSSL